MACPGSWRLLLLAMALLTVPSFVAAEENSAASLRAIPEGTRCMIRLEDKLDVNQIRPGKRFKAKLMEDIMGPDETMVLHGSSIKGHVSEVGNGFHPRLLLSFDEIHTRRGWTPLMASVLDVPGEHGLTIHEEGAIERRGQGGEHHDSDSGGMASKAAAAAGVMKAVFGDHRLQLEKGTILEIRLDRALRVPWRE